MNLIMSHILIMVLTFFVLFSDLIDKTEKELEVNDYIDSIVDKFGEELIMIILISVIPFLNGLFLFLSILNKFSIKLSDYLDLFSRFVVYKLKGNKWK